MLNDKYMFNTEVRTLYCYYRFLILYLNVGKYQEKKDFLIMQSIEMNCLILLTNNEMA